MTVGADYAAWLKAPALYVVAGSTPIATAYGDQAVDTEVISPIALGTDATVEARAQEDFLGGPLVRDKIVIYGLRSDLIAKLIRVKGDRLGYEGDGALAFVVAAAEQEGPRMTILSVIKKLAP